MIWKDKPAAFFKLMSLLWILPSAGSGLILAMSEEKTGDLNLERVAAGMILGAHVYLVYRWLGAPKRQ